MIQKYIDNEHAGSYTSRQRLFLSFTFAVLVDLTVLNIFNEYWDKVFLESFTVSLYAALLLQFLLKITLVLEHKVASYIKTNSELKTKVLRFLSAWAIVFTSKLVILEAINLSFGDSVLFLGPIHGLVAFIVVIMAMIVGEQMMALIYRLLAK